LPPTPFSPDEEDRDEEERDEETDINTTYIRKRWRYK
jgi:hypothetical protein